MALPAILAVDERLRTVAYEMKCSKRIRVKISASHIHSSFHRFVVVKGWLHTERIQSFRHPRHKLDPQVLHLTFNVYASLSLDNVHIRALDLVLATSELAFDVIVKVYLSPMKPAPRRTVRNLPELEVIRLRILVFIVDMCKLRPALLLLPAPYIWLDAKGIPCGATFYQMMPAILSTIATKLSTNPVSRKETSGQHRC